jgi:hypothetical protein
MTWQHAAWETEVRTIVKLSQEGVWDLEITLLDRSHLIFKAEVSSPPG